MKGINRLRHSQLEPAMLATSSLLAPVRPWCLLVTGALVALQVACGAATQDGPADTGPAVVDAMRERILAHLALRPGMVVAEIGLGRGWFVFRVAEAVGPSGVVYATDIDPEAIASMQEQLAHINPAAGHVDLRLCHDARDTALDNLPDAHVDVVLMVDSLCFDADESRERNVAYLRRFLRILRPGGRLVHHMDCRCDIAPDAVVAQFTDAGFSPRVESVDVPTVPTSANPSSPCLTDAARRRQAFVAVFRKPGATTDTTAAHGAPVP
jgi:SAM-dependent methyltransferase